MANERSTERSAGGEQAARAAVRRSARHYTPRTPPIARARALRRRIVDASAGVTRR